MRDRKGADRRWREGLLALPLAFPLACGSSGPSEPDDPDDPPATAEFQVVQGANQSAPAGTTLPYIPIVRLVDGNGSPMSGVSVEFEVTGGGGTVFPVIPVTSAAGIAAANWRLGAGAGANALRVSAPGAQPLEIQATGRGIQTPFDIELSFEDADALTAAQRASLDAAVRKVRSIFSASPPTAQANTPEFECAGVQVPPMNREVSNPIVRVAVRELGVDEGVEDLNPDFAGVGTVCLFLFVQGQDDFRQTVLGAVVLNEPKLADLEAIGALEPVLTHELMHSMGFGSIWGADPDLGWSDLVQDRGGADPRFLGSDAIAAYGATEGNEEGSVPVPLENQLGEGSNDSHWREALLSPELMNAQTELGFAPLSAVSIAALADLGYSMSPAQADSFQVASLVEAARLPARSGRAELSEALGRILEPDLLRHSCALDELPPHRAIAMELRTGTHTWRVLR